MFCELGETNKLVHPEAPCPECNDASGEFAYRYSQMGSYYSLLLLFAAISIMQVPPSVHCGLYFPCFTV